jgi:hypothetical protein
MKKPVDSHGQGSVASEKEKRKDREKTPESIQGSTTGKIPSGDFLTNPRQ